MPLGPAINGDSTLPVAMYPAATSRDCGLVGRNWSGAGSLLIGKQRPWRLQGMTQEFVLGDQEIQLRQHRQIEMMGRLTRP